MSERAPGYSEQISSRPTESTPTPVASKSPEASRKEKETSWFERAEQRHRLAQAGVQLEHVLDNVIDHKNAEAILRASGIPPEMHSAFRRVIDEYRQVNRISDMVVEDLELNADWKKKNDEEKGAWIYERLMHRSPRGRVEFYRYGALLAVSCADREDYVALTTRPKSGGVFMAYREYEFFQALEGETVRGHIPLAVLSESRNVEWFQVLLHERQHFVNHRLLNLFVEDEIRGPVKDPILMKRRIKTKRVRDIKDEVLAYMREPERSSSIQDCLTSELYDALFDNLSTSEENRIDHVLTRIDREWSRFPSVLKSYPEIIVHQLYDIPFERIPSYLRMMRRYYEKVLQPNRAMHTETEVLKKQYGQRLYPLRVLPEFRELLQAVAGYESSLGRLDAALLGVRDKGHIPMIVEKQKENIVYWKKQLAHEGIESPYVHLDTDAQVPITARSTHFARRNNMLTTVALEAPFLVPPLQHQQRRMENDYAPSFISPPFQKLERLIQDEFREGPATITYELRGNELQISVSYELKHGDQSWKQTDHFVVPFQKETDGGSESLAA